MFEFNMPVAYIPENYRAFLPSIPTPAIDELIDTYERGEANMRELHAHIMSDEVRPTLQGFAKGAELYNKSKCKSVYWALDLVEMFDLQKAISARTETFWFELFDLCCLSKVLPSALWEQWRESFQAWRTPGKDGQKHMANIPTFDRSTVMRCLTLIEGHRANFFSMRVDALWKSLSGSHKTNLGSGFHKRFILANAFNEYGSTKNDQQRAIVDLINICSCVLTGADDPFFDVEPILLHARNKECGEWVDVMEGHLQFRAYMVGTLHVEVHPEIANRLNIALAYLHPNGLTDKIATKRPSRKSGFGSEELIRRPIGGQVRSYLRAVYCSQRADGLWQVTPGHAMFITSAMGSVIKGMIEEVLALIGGQREGNIHLFDYPPKEVIAEIVRTGEVPDKQSYQFYCTTTETAAEFVAWVGAEESAICYETSAGTGAIAKQMPLQTYCVEVDRLRAMALDKMGFEVKQADFLTLSPSDLHGEADYVMMNPPYAGRAWQDHFEHAAKFVRAGGTVAAILPEGAPRKMPTVAGMEVTYTMPKRNRFKDTSIEVVFAKWVRPLI